MCKKVYLSELEDLDIDVLGKRGFSPESYFPDGSVSNMAKFIMDVYNDGMEIICQCEYGQSRSAGCAAAILEHFFHRGISIFADYKYFPNKLIYNKLLEELNKIDKR